MRGPRGNRRPVPAQLRVVHAREAAHHEEPLRVEYIGAWSRARMFASEPSRTCSSPSAAASWKNSTWPECSKSKHPLTRTLRGGGGGASDMTTVAALASSRRPKTSVARAHAHTAERYGFETGAVLETAPLLDRDCFHLAMTRLPLLVIALLCAVRGVRSARRGSRVGRAARARPEPALPPPRSGSAAPPGASRASSWCARPSWYRGIPSRRGVRDRIFAPVWTTLYARTGCAAARVAAVAGALAPIELALAHYALNIAWAPIFFGLKYFKTALVVQLLLVASLVEIMRQFFAVSGALSAALLAPYLAWLVFATALNFELCRLNPNPRASIAGSPAR